MYNQFNLILIYIVKQEKSNNRIYLRNPVHQAHRHQNGITDVEGAITAAVRDVKNYGNMTINVNVNVEKEK